MSPPFGSRHTYRYGSKEREEVLKHPKGGDIKAHKSHTIEWMSRMKVRPSNINQE